MKDGVDFKTAKKVHEIEIQSDRVALKYLKKLGLKDKQLVNEDELVTIVQAMYPDNYDVIVNVLMNSVYLKWHFVVDLKAKRDSSDLLIK
jgi:hypothetical protein